MSNIYSIYKATNIINNKCYIGFDKQWPARQKAHYYESLCETIPQYNYHFHRSIRKNGWNNFIWEIIYQSQDGKHCLKTMEHYFIQQYDSFHNGYNMTLGGEGTIGFVRPGMYGNTNPMAILRVHKGSFVKGVKLGPNSLETIEKKRVSKLGPKNPNYGNPDAAKPFNQKKACNKCGVITTLGNLKRWHNENCRKES